MKGKLEKKVYKNAPLPFQGQKRHFVENFKKALEELMSSHQINTVVDLFGGSGLLSHISKRIYPDVRVIYNDYDDFYHRLELTQTTNQLLSDIRNYLKDIPKGQKIKPSMKYLILSLIKDTEKREQQIDYITLSSSLLFSGKFAKTYKELERQTFYNKVKQSNYYIDEYLCGLEVVRLNYIDLFNQFKQQQNILFIVDPPYLCTDTTSYNSNKYWKLKDYLDVLNVLREGRYIYFTSNKSSLIELCDWISTNYKIDNPFIDAKVKTVNVSINSTSKYTDMMLYKYQC